MARPLRRVLMKLQEHAVISSPNKSGEWGGDRGGGGGGGRGGGGRERNWSEVERDNVREMGGMRD